MNIFHCDHCDQPVFFENVQCLNCHHRLAFIPDVGSMCTLAPIADTNTWRVLLHEYEHRRYKLCSNYDDANVCNWALPADDTNTLCESCRLTRVIPDLSVDGNVQAWYRLEVAKRRLVYTLLKLRLPIDPKQGDEPTGLAFEFLADTAEQRVFTGHSNGVITLNIEEADDAIREKRRVQLHEPYRTLLGHFRHEVGHYYWNVLIESSEHLHAYRALFGDERQDYSQALKQHYANGPAADWTDNYISAYASSHPWEDWAETWAHYLHMADALETSHSVGLTIRPRKQTDPSLDPKQKTLVGSSFSTMLKDWFALTFVLNNLNRGLGLQDGYPFVLSSPVIEKLKFVHEVIRGERAAVTY